MRRGPKPKPARSRLGRPVITSLAGVTLLAGATFVMVAIASTGSTRPWDWTRADLPGALARYQLCQKHSQGLAFAGCMLAAGSRSGDQPAYTSTSARGQLPLPAAPTVDDIAPVNASSAGAAPGFRPGSNTVAAGSKRSASGSGSNATSNRSWDDCRGTMKPAPAAGSECEGLGNPETAPIPDE